MEMLQVLRKAVLANPTTSILEIERMQGAFFIDFGEVVYVDGKLRPTLGIGPVIYVGKDWLKANLTEEELALCIADMLTTEPKY